MLNSLLRDRYQIQALLGRQTGRRTFLAVDLETRSSVVVKLLLFAPDFTWDDLKLFEREAETLKSLNHPAIPKYLDFFEVETELGKGFALVQSYIEARSLREWIQSGRSFSEAELKGIAKALLVILTYLHQRQPPVIHRDLKPSNILLEERSGNSPGTIYLVDFGSVQTASHGGTMTVVGTYGYMPPEQFGGRSLPASDLYSVGATLIYLATGQEPADLPQKSLQVAFEPFTSLSSSFMRWIQWLSSPHASGRPASAEAALKVDFYQPFQPTSSQGAALSPKPHLSLASRPPSEIQLKKTTRTLEVKVPNRQLLYAASRKESSFYWFVILGFFIVLSYVGVMQWLFPGFLILISLYQFLASLRSKNVALYQVLFEQEGHSISVSLIATNANESRLITFLSQGKLHSLSAGAHLPKYQLNVHLHGRSEAFCITGSRAEMQWLCDELNEWTGLEIYRWAPPPA